MMVLGGKFRDDHVPNFKAIHPINLDMEFIKIIELIL